MRTTNQLDPEFTDGVFAITAIVIGAASVIIIALSILLLVLFFKADTKKIPKRQLRDKYK